jgi:hypothetical protein
VLLRFPFDKVPPPFPIGFKVHQPLCFPLTALMFTVKGLKLVAAVLPFAVIVPGVTSAAVADEFDLQHRSFVLVTFVSGAVVV